MVRFVDWILLGACALFSTTYAIPQPLASPVAILEARATTVRTKVVTRVSTGRGGHVKTFTTTRTLVNTQKTHTSKVKTHIPPTTTPTTTTTTTTTPAKPTYTGTPGTCDYAASAGGEFTDSNGVTFDVQCGALIGGTPFSTVNSASFGDCLSLCSANANCLSFEWDYAQLVAPAQCLLYNVVVTPATSLISDAGVVVKR